MNIGKITSLLELIERHQNRLIQINTLLEESDTLISPSTKANVISQLVELASTTTYVLVNELAKNNTAIMATPNDLLTYTLSPEDLDNEIDSYSEDDDDDEEETDSNNEEC